MDLFRSLDLGIFVNFDLLTVGIAMAVLGTLGFTVYFNDPKSATSRAFLLFSIANIAWGFFNYFQYQFGADAALWYLRLSLFCAVWQAYSLYRFFVVFPNSDEIVSWLHSRILLPYVGLVSILALTPLVLSQTTAVNATGHISSIQNGPAMPIFGMTGVALVVAGLYTFARKIKRSPIEQRRPFFLVLLGAFLTFVGIITFNLILPTLLNQSQFIAFGALFMLPLALAIAYAIGRGHLFRLKVTATSFLVSGLAVTTFVEIVFANTPELFTLRVAVFALVMIAGVSLVRSVYREVEQREKIEELSNDKSEFMTFASHEIRNPITAMRGYASLIVDGTVGPVSEQVTDIARRILVEGNDVLNLIAQYLSKSKMELGKIQYMITPFDIGKSVVSIVDGYVPHAQQKGVRLEKHIDESHSYMVSGDEGKLKEVVGNLIDNSIKYTREGSISVAVERHGVAIRVTIQDTGVGIPADVLPQLFKKFSRADAQKVNLLGTGIGLYLAKTFIEGMGARIWAESDGLNKGSRFIIEFPIPHKDAH